MPPLHSKGHLLCIDRGLRAPGGTCTLESFKTSLINPFCCFHFQKYHQVRYQFFKSINLLKNLGKDSPMLYYYTLICTQLRYNYPFWYSCRFHCCQLYTSGTHISKTLMSSAILPHRLVSSHSPSLWLGRREPAYVPERSLSTWERKIVRYCHWWLWCRDRRGRLSLGSLTAESKAYPSWNRNHLKEPVVCWKVSGMLIFLLFAGWKAKFEGHVWLRSHLTRCSEDHQNLILAVSRGTSC